MGWTGVLRRSVRRERAVRAIEVAATPLSAGAAMRCRAGSINLTSACIYPWQNLGRSYRVQSPRRWPTGPMLHRPVAPALQHARHGARAGCRSQQGASPTGASDGAISHCGIQVLSRHAAMRLHCTAQDRTKRAGCLSMSWDASLCLRILCAACCATTRVHGS